MLKSISNLGSTLNKKEQQSINGGSACFPFDPCGLDEKWDFGLCQCVLTNS
ncbi:MULTISPECIES: hypothetical protein [unclassified Tenacibaculum]|uniref:hypothetical protein n=1 Tax=unclassified Tenacibaculum TaxID=2635139 RepID=UPI001F2F1EF3|nr:MULTISPECIES: hypothetical protein [unclassified Tenacibaculum]MCF2873361.1 hypothetical protein [Tenacibaculum sp. Cn5-1]MCF2933517.1 hypothetical protein [Tenacibaculum sp. Cn5-34]MCG7509901.1 hypothetical protein [Tenacibaculum sp. Cn5-46]